MENPFNHGYWTETDLVKFGFCKVGVNVKVAKNCTIVGLGNISFGNNVRIDGPTVISASSGHVRIGDFVHVGGFCFLAGAGGIDMDDFSGLSQGVRIYSASDDYSGNSLTNPTVPREYLNVRVAPVKLGRHVIIGSGSTILPGCSIGDGSSVGANSLVNKSLGEWGVYFGAPAKRIKNRSKNLLALESDLYSTIANNPA